jgi:putative membrane protein
MISGEADTGPPRRSWIGTLLMLPLGLIIALVLLYLAFLRGYRPYFPGEFLFVLLVILLGLFVIRTLYWRSRRKNWQERFKANQPIRILRQRYARGEITKEQYDQMLRDLEQKPR